MKKFSIILLFSFISLNLSAQLKRHRVIVQIGGGYHFGKFENDGLKNVIDLFNQNNPDGQMPIIEQISGGSASLSVFGNIGSSKGHNAPLFFDFMYNSRSKSVQGFSSNLNKLQNIRFRSHNGSFGIGIMPAVSDYLYVALAVSGDLGFNSQMVSYSNQVVESIQDDITFGATVTLPFIIAFGEKSPLSISIRPFYHIQLSDIDFNLLNQKVNYPGKESILDIPDYAIEPYKEKTKNWGVAFHINLMLYKQYYLCK